MDVFKINDDDDDNVGFLLFTVLEIVSVKNSHLFVLSGTNNLLYPRFYVLFFILFCHMFCFICLQNTNFLMAMFLKFVCSAEIAANNNKNIVFFTLLSAFPSPPRK